MELKNEYGIDVICGVTNDECYLITAPGYEAKIGDIVVIEDEGVQVNTTAAIVMHCGKDDQNLVEKSIKAYGKPENKAIAIYRKEWCADNA